MKPTLETIIDELTAEAYANIGKQFTAIADAQEQIAEAIVLAEVLESVNAIPMANLYRDSCGVWVLAPMATHEEVMAALVAARLSVGEDESHFDGSFTHYAIEGFQVRLHVNRPALPELKLAA